jgi:hypothetical protein
MQSSFTKAASALVLAATVAASSSAVFAQSMLAKKGDQIQARLTTTLDSGKLHDGDTFTMTEHEGFFHHAPPALRGAVVEGHVENVEPAHIGHAAKMNVVFDDIKLADGTTAPIDAQVTSMGQLEPKKHILRDTTLIVGGYVVGHHMAAAHHGGMAGAAGGFALATSLKSNIVVKKGTLVELKFRSPVMPGSASSM